MHFVAALNDSHALRCVLCLSETVVTGAADGYARMQGKPAVTLLHLGPGLGNGLANLHNARKAHSPVLNIVGDHATYHIEMDAPLTADIEGIARPVSNWVKTSASAADLAVDATEALHEARKSPGHVATLILPANTAWEASNAMPQDPPPPEPAAKISADRIDVIAQLLQRRPAAAMILTGNALTEAGLEAASQIRQATGCQFYCQTSNARLPRGEGRVAITPVPYAVDAALAELAPYRHIIGVGAKPPVAFFAYPGKPSRLAASDAETVQLSHIHEDGEAALCALAEALQASSHAPELEVYHAPAPLPDGTELTMQAIAHELVRQMPADSIVVDEAISNSRNLPTDMHGARKHDWLQICGGSIGDGFPLATGAAVACPERRVIALQADGSGMYSLQALWTQARERLAVTTIILSNRAYAILQHELANVGAEPGQVTRDLMELTRPTLDWVKLAEGMGVNAAAATTSDEFAKQLAIALAQPGPYLIEARL